MSNIVEQTEQQTLSSQDVFRLRMLSQCRQIKQYRQAVLKETGRLLTIDEAALEWIQLYAATFDLDYPLNRS